MKIIHFSIGPVGAAVLGFITVPIITWFFLPEDIGRIAMLQLTASFSVLLFSLGLDQAYVREFHDSASTPLLLKNTLLPGFLLVILVSALLFSNPGYLSNLLFNVDSIFFGLIVIVCIVSAYLSRFLSLILRMKEKGIAFSMSQLLPKIIFLALIGIYVGLEASFTFSNLIVAHALSIILVCVIYVWNTRNEWIAACKKKFDIEQVMGMFSYSVPLIFSGLAYWGLTAVDRVFLRTLSTYEELGIYSVAANFAAAATVFQSIFTTVWAPTVYKWVSAGEDLEKVERVTSYVLFFVVFIFCMAGIFSWMIGYILPDSFNSVKYIVVACFGFPLLYTLSEAAAIGIGVTKKTGYTLAAAVIALAFNIVGNYCLIPLYGAAGAAVSTCAAFWIFFVCRTEFSFLVWRKMPRSRLYFFSVACVALAVTMAVSKQLSQYFIILLWATLLLILFVFNKNILSTIKKYAFSRFL